MERDRELSLALARAEMILENHPEIRPGQAVWNACVSIYPDLNHLAGGRVDCFHNDRAIPALLHLMLWRNRRKDE